MSGTKGMLHYAQEIKRKAVKLYLEEHHSYTAISQELGIRKSARIEIWVRMYRREGEASFCKPIGRPLKDESGQRELERLRMENALLKKFRAELRKQLLVQRNIG
jgi:transposase-like protein